MRRNTKICSKPGNLQNIMMRKFTQIFEKLRKVTKYSLRKFAAGPETYEIL